nr:DUF2087 domain-containing protein [Sedimentibacter sp.]
MKIIVINGSPKGENSNTNIMVNEFLKGAQSAGAETVNIFLSEKKIEYCKGCHICWSRGPAQCVISDDMTSVLMHMGDANVIVFASPVYFENISGMLKVFMDRMTMIGGPQSQKDTEAREEKKPESAKINVPKLMMISSCGFADESEFEVTSLWINRVSQKMHMELVGEIYATNGKLLKETPEELKPALAKFMNAIEKAGYEIGTEMKMTQSTKNFLNKNISWNDIISNNMKSIKPFLDDDGKIKQVPVPNKNKIQVLDYLANKFEQGKSYKEKEVNEIIDDWHTFGDYFLLRRLLIDYKLLMRTANGDSYWVNDKRI